MGKTQYGYSMKKIEEKAAKRGMTPAKYLNYLQMRANGMIVFPAGKGVSTNA
jgi:hypothetical protein